MQTVAEALTSDASPHRAPLSAAWQHRVWGLLALGAVLFQGVGFSIPRSVLIGGGTIAVACTWLHLSMCR